MRYAVIAILAALAAVAAGAQVASGNDPSQARGPGSLTGGPLTTPFQQGSSIRIHATGKPRRPTTRRGLRSSGRRLLRAPGPVGSDNYMSPPNLSTDINSNSGCRFPSECGFFASNGAAENDVGATTQGVEDANSDQCVFNSSTITYKATVWYAFQVTHTGILEMSVDGSATTGFVPIILVAPYDTSTSTPDFSSGFCQLADAGSQTLATGSITVAAGTVVAVAVGAQSSGTTGQYDLGFSWDPDTDGDGGLDSIDQCDAQRGPASQNYCPDRDGDGIRDSRDACPDQKGAAGPADVNGCPDPDGDGLRGKHDACPFESSRGKPDANANGCPDYKALPNLDVSGGGFKKGNVFVGIKFATLKLSKLPKGTKVSIKCKPKRSCKIHRRGKIRKGSLLKRLRRVRFGRHRVVKVTVTEKKKGYVSKVFTFKAGYHPAAGGGRNTFLTTPKKKCIPVTGGKARKCTSAMLLR